MFSNSFGIRKLHIIKRKQLVYVGHQNMNHQNINKFNSSCEVSVFIEFEYKSSCALYKYFSLMAKLVTLHSIVDSE